MNSLRAATGAGCAGGGDAPGNLYTGQRQVEPGGESGHASKINRTKGGSMKEKECWLFDMWIDLYRLGTINSNAEDGIDGPFINLEFISDSQAASEVTMTMQHVPGETGQRVKLSITREQAQKLIGVLEKELRDL